MISIAHVELFPAPGFSLLTEWLSTRIHFILLGVALSLLLLLMKVAWKQWRIFAAFQKVPSNSGPQHLIFGHVPRMLTDMGEMLDDFRKVTVENKWKMMKVRIGPGMYILFATHPEVAQVVLRSDPKWDQMYNALIPWLGRSLLIANGKQWARARRLLTSAFHFDILRPYFKVYNDAARLLVSKWSRTPERHSFDVYHSLSLLTLDIVLRCACSFESNCQISNSPLSYYNIIYMMIPNGWRNCRACEIVHKFSMDVIKNRRAVLEEKKKDGEHVQRTKRKYLDFIDILLEARDEDNVGLTDLEIRAEVDTFMVGGHDTTSSALAWTLYNLAIHPEHQEKCCQEVDAIFCEKDENEDINHADIKQLLYLKYCIKESMRLFPPVCGIGRMLDQDTNIAGCVMPRGTAIFCLIYSIHRHPDFWENPDEFDPLRFAPENSKGRHPYAFIPFSAGPRNCIGQEFAMNEELVTLAHILRKFEIPLDETRPPMKDYLLILRPKPGLFLKQKHRNL